MLAEERYAAILELLSRKGAATISELAEAVGTSESTVRRDLGSLDKAGRLNKVHGGATALESEFVSVERDVLTKESLNVEEKERIGAYAAGQVSDGDVIFLDAGTTTLHMAEHMTAVQATFVTNGIAHARVLNQRGCRVYLLGGLLKPTTEAIIGIGAVNSLKQFNFTKAFLGVNGVTAAQGLTTPDIEEALVKTAAAQRAYMVYALADHTKFNKVFAATILPLDKACIITDYLTDQSLSQKTIIKEVDKL